MNNLIYRFELKQTLGILIADIIAIGFVIIMPAVSHMLPFPIFYLDPMRLVLLSVYFLQRNHKNAFILALVLPIFSMLVSGHPVFYKAILISVELFVNVLLIHLLIRKGLNIFFAVFLGITLSKIVYYIAKFLFIEWSLISGELVTTNPVIQLAITIGISIFFFLFVNTRVEESAPRR